MNSTTVHSCYSDSHFARKNLIKLMHISKGNNTKYSEKKISTKGDKIRANAIKVELDIYTEKIHKANEDDRRRDKQTR